MAENDKAMSLEEHEKRLVAIERAMTPGLGAPDSTFHRPPRRPAGANGILGLGETPGDSMPVEEGVWALLAAGSPRLALARALGVGFRPLLINIRATFSNTDVIDVPPIGSDVKITEDTLVDALLLDIENQSNTANLSLFQSQSDFFYRQQSCIQATLDVQGAPRYTVAPRFTPLTTLADTFNGNSKWPRGWILTYQQQLFMAFHAAVTLPFAPIEVICTFRSYTAIGDLWDGMRNRDAIEDLGKLGIVLSDAYKTLMIARG